MVEIYKGSGSGACQKCGKVMGKGQLIAYEHIICRVWNIGHLNCFSPRSQFPLDLEDITLSEDLSEAEIAAVEKWTNAWNREFQVVVPEKYLRKAVKTKSPPSRRVLIEAFTYLTFTEVEQAAGLACRAWFHVTRDEELWRRLCLAYFLAPVSGCSYRGRVVAKRLESCWHCGKQLTLMEVAMVCPVRGRWLCKRCFGDYDCRIEKLTEYCSSRSLSYKLVKALQVPTFRYKGSRAVYVSDIRDQILPYALSRCQKLINLMEKDYSPEACESVRGLVALLRLEDFYSAKCEFPPGVMKPLCELLGMAEEGECFRRNVRKFLNKLAGS